MPTLIIMFCCGIILGIQIQKIFKERPSSTVELFDQTNGWGSVNATLYSRDEEGLIKKTVYKIDGNCEEISGEK